MFAGFFSFKGRLRRLDFWLFSSAVFGAMVTTAAIVAYVLHVDLADHSDFRTPLIEAGAIALFMWPNLAVCAKRLHDRGQSGWWVLLSYLPVIGNVSMVVNLGIMRGSPGANRYGDEPERAQMTLIERSSLA